MAYGDGLDKGKEYVKFIVWLFIGGFVLWFLYMGFDLVGKFMD